MTDGGLNGPLGDDGAPWRRQPNFSEGLAITVKSTVAGRGRPIIAVLRHNDGQPRGVHAGAVVVEAVSFTASDAAKAAAGHRARGSRPRARAPGPDPRAQIVVYGGGATGQRTASRSREDRRRARRRAVGASRAVTTPAGLPDKAFPVGQTGKTVHRSCKWPWGSPRDPATGRDADLQRHRRDQQGPEAPIASSPTTASSAFLFTVVPAHDGKSPSTRGRRVDSWAVVRQDIALPSGAGRPGLAGVGGQFVAPRACRRRGGLPAAPIAPIKISRLSGARRQ